MKNKFKAAAVAAAALIMVASSVSSSVILADEKTAVPAESTAVGSIGSVSKTVCAAAAMQLVDEGKLELDAPVTDYLPDFRMADSRCKDITIRMLLSHTSGLMGTSGEDFMLFDDRDSDPHDTLLEKLSKQKLKADPGAFSAYCNDGFSLLELVIEEVSGESFSDYVEKHIFSPLGMKDSGTALGDAFRSSGQAGVFVNGSWIKEDYCMASASGGVICSAADLSRFGKAFFTGNTELLSEKSKNEMKKRNIDEEYEGGYGLGWDTVESDDYAKAGVQVIEKGGDLNYQHASLVVAPDENISVSVISSGGNSAVDQLLAKALLDVALEEKGIKVEHPAPEPKETLTEVPEKYKAYEGLYLAPTSVVRITFPDMKFMRIEDLTAETSSVSEYMYTTEDSFVSVEGNIERGKAVESKDHLTLKLSEYDGRDCFVSSSCYDLGTLGYLPAEGYDYIRAEDITVSDEAQKSWEARNGKKYYICSEKYSSVMYSAQPSMKVNTVPDLPGYTNLGTIVDGNHITYNTAMPGSRDLENYTAFSDSEGDKIRMENCNITLISEDSIPVLEEGTESISLRTKNASWYTVGKSLEGKTVTLDIPENAAVYIYDSYDKLHYTSYMKNYGSKVTLPKEGKIVFLGEDGGKITVS
ncbi:MAG: serine hydrolase [Ruminococcus sp.]|nr:serine hydrolase [Ruminococcus sp.]